MNRNMGGKEEEKAEKAPVKREETGKATEAPSPPPPTVHVF